MENIDFSITGESISLYAYHVIYDPEPDKRYVNEEKNVAEAIVVAESIPNVCQKFARYNPSARLLCIEVQTSHKIPLILA